MLRPIVFCVFQDASCSSSSAAPLSWNLRACFAHVSNLNAATHFFCGLQGASCSSPAAGPPSWNFRACSYNILADKYAHKYKHYLYRDVPSACLHWEHRQKVLLQEMAHYHPDVVYLQEVDHYTEIEAGMQELGYAGAFQRCVKFLTITATLEAAITLLWPCAPILGSKTNQCTSTSILRAYSFHNYDCCSCHASP